MSLTSRNITQNQGTVDRDLGKIFVWDNRYRDVIFLNDTGAELSLLGGELLAVVAASGKAVLLDDIAAVDGSAIPVGFANSCPTLAIGAEIQISMCIAGDVVEEKVILGGTVALTDVVQARTIRDRIASDTMGVKLVSSTELSNFDN